MERTLVIIKPDAVQAGHIGEIISVYERAGLRIEYAHMAQLSVERASAFYAEHKGKDFYDGLIEFMTSGRCLILVVAGENAVARVRHLNGATDPREAAEGTIRARFGSELPRNAVHASESLAAAEREIAFFFPGVSARG